MGRPSAPVVVAAGRRFGLARVMLGGPMRALKYVAVSAASLSIAHAQPAPSHAREGLGAFINVCLNTAADRVAAIEAAQSSGWTLASVADIPRSRRGPSDNPLTHNPNPPPVDSVAFVARTAGDGVLVLQLATAERNGVRRTQCTLYAPGVDERELAAALYPNESARQRDFLATPLAFLSANGRSFMATVAWASVEGPYAGDQTFAFFTMDGAPLP